MKRLPTLVLLLFIAVVASSQQLSQVTFSNASTLAYFSFSTDNNVLIRVSEDGKILEWGTEMVSDRGGYFSPKLQSYLGRVEYYDAGSDSAAKGKIKSIGTAYITYYESYESSEKVGKLKSIGSINFDYYSKYDDKTLLGKIKMIGDLMLERYSSYDNDAYKGKLKSVGNTPITYYSVFDDRQNSGKLKSIGTAGYSWYTIGDRPELKGGLKTGNYRQNIGGITYILR